MTNTKGRDLDMYCSQFYYFKYIHIEACKKFFFDFFLITTLQNQRTGHCRNEFNILDNKQSIVYVYLLKHIMCSAHLNDKKGEKKVICMTKRVNTLGSLISFIRKINGDFLYLIIHIIQIEKFTVQLVTSFMITVVHLPNKLLQRSIISMCYHGTGIFWSVWLKI